MWDWIVILVSAALSIVLPVAIICVRQTVKIQRQEVIGDLTRIFEPKDVKPGSEQIIPSFEFVKFKYSVAAEDEKTADPHNPHPTHGRDFSKTMFVVASVPLMLVLFVLGVVAFGALISLVMGKADTLKLIQPLPAWVLKEDRIAELHTWLAMLVVAYIASYLFIIRELLRAVANFELSPMTLLLNAIHVLFGVVTAVLLASVAGDVMPDGLKGATTSALLLAAFAVGFIPELGLRTLMRATKLYLFKREDDDVYKYFSATPVEVLDGIDTEVRSRLSLHHIASVQNLATANPIMLFVETPYGVYQIIDWVAQAQLCSALGPKAVLEFWKLGIRTIFDLERALTGGNSTIELRHEVGKIIVLARSPEERERLGLSATSPASDITDKTVMALAAVILDDLHIQRLRQIANCIAERLGLQNLHLIHIAEPWRPTGVRGQGPAPGPRPSGGNGHTAPGATPPDGQRDAPPTPDLPPRPEAGPNN